MEELIMGLCSFIFSIKGEIKNLQYLLLSLLTTLKKYLNNSKDAKLKKIKRYIYLILAFESMKFNFNFMPEKLGNFFPDDQKLYEDRIKKIKEVVLDLDNSLRIANGCDIINSVKFEHFIVSFLVAKYNSGFILDFNLPGLTKTLIEIVKSNK